MFLLLLDFVLCLVSNVTASVFSNVLLSVEYVAVAIRWIHYSSICGNAEVFLVCKYIKLVTMCLVTCKLVIVNHVQFSYI